MSISDDPVADFNRKDAEETAWLERRPICHWCYHHIQDERLWDINDEFLHEECARKKYERDTEDFIE